MKNTLLYIIFLSLAFSVYAESPPTLNNTIAINTTMTFDRLGNGDLKVYPNPASNYIKVTDNDEIDKVLIYNILGRIVKRFDAETNRKYYIQDLPKGMYIVRLLDKNQDLILTKRINKRA